MKVHFVQSPMVYVYVSNASFAVELQCVNVPYSLCLFSKWNFYPKEALKSDVVQCSGWILEIFQMQLWVKKT